MKTRKNPFEDKRVKTLTSLNSSAKDWKPGRVINFGYRLHQTKAGKLIEEWFPIFHLDGYTNPFDKDALNERDKRCQLCDTEIVRYGVIVNDDRKEYLCVGLECFGKYQFDDDDIARAQKFLDMLLGDHIEQRIVEEKAKIKTLLEGVLAKDESVRWKDNVTQNAWYTFYSTIIRDRWLGWMKTKFSNFVKKNAQFFDYIGYEPAKDVIGIKNYIEFYRKIASFKVRQNLLDIQAELIQATVGYSVRFWSRKFDYRIHTTTTKKTLDEVFNMTLENIKSYDIDTLIDKIRKDDLKSDIKNFEYTK